MQNKIQEPTYRVLWPLARIDVQAAPLVSGLQDLSGKTICELWDYIFRGDVAYALLREHLQRSYADIRFVPFSKFGNIHGPRQREILAALPKQLLAEGCDAVISGIGA